jgi:nucleotide-binding universal stress UspA family protein
MFTSVLVGLDGSRASQVALAQAILIGRRFRSRVVLAHVLEREPIGSGLARAVGAAWMERWTTGAGSEEAARAASQLLEDAAAAVRRAGLQAEIALRTGDVVEVMQELSEGVGVVVVGRAGVKAGADPLGPDVRALVRKLHRPLLVCGSATSPMDRCLVAYGGSSLSEQALTFAARYAAITDAHLDVVHVTADPEAGLTVLARAAHVLSVTPVRFETHLVEGSLEEGIADAVRRLAVNAAFTGAHRADGEQLVASHTEVILRATDIPVLVHAQPFTPSLRASGAYRHPASG